MDELMNQINFDQVFLNTPIDSKEKDFISVGTYADRIKSAIKDGAHMVGLIGPFGVGKSSVVSLLEEANKNCDDAPSMCKVSMWSVLCNGEKDGEVVENENNNIELHKSLIYQIASAIETDSGTYVSRRLNKSFSMISVHSKNGYEKIILIVALIALVICFSIYNNYDVMSKLLIGHEYIWLWFLIALCVVLVATIIMGIFGVELIYTRDKRDSANGIEENEIIDLYRTTILKKRICSKQNDTYNPHKIIVVIEDLDRTEEKESVVNFLKELKKYYLISENNRYKNEVVFIVNIGPESSLMHCEDNGGKNSLYSKVFDFTLELPKINIQNYEEILVSLLSQKNSSKDELKDLIKNSTGFQWILRDTDKYANEKFGIRQLKERLNIAFNLYVNLSQKAMSKDDVDFDKCAAFAFVITAYEEEFQKTKDDDFEKIVNSRIKGENILEVCKLACEEANIRNESYINEIINLVEANLIDCDYRTYFYNYPIGCGINSSYETIIRNAILYGKGSENILSEALGKVAGTASNIIEESLSNIEVLGIVPNDLIFNNSKLLKIVICQYNDLFEKKLRNLDYSELNKSKNMSLICSSIDCILDSETFDSNYIEKICTILNEKCEEKILVDFRKLFCLNYPNRILLFKSLFFGMHSVISKEEMQSIEMDSAIELINVSSQVFNYENINDFIDVFSDRLRESEKHNDIDMFIIDCKQYISIENYIELLLNYMQASERLIPDMEDCFISYMNNKANFKGKNEARNTLLEKYQLVINNHVKRFHLSANTQQQINNMDIERLYLFSEDVAKRLLESEDYINYTLIMLANNKFVNFSDNNVCASIEDNLGYLMEHTEWLLRIRKCVECISVDALKQYLFMFDGECPSVTDDEIRQILYVSDNDIDLMFDCLNINDIDEDRLNLILNYVNTQKIYKNGMASLILRCSELPLHLQQIAFNSIDFSQIKFLSLSKQDMKIVYANVESAFSLNTVLGRINFMKLTRHIFFDWQNDELISEITADNTKALAYIEAINVSIDKRISPYVAKIVADLDGYYKASPLLQEALYKKGYYSKYIAGKILWDNKFILESGKEGTKLWPNYVNVYKKAELELKSIMGSSADFSRRYLESEILTIDVIKEKSNCYYPLCQTKEIVTMIFEDGNQEFIKEYFSKIGGFCDEAAATCFIDMLRVSAVAKNQSIYNNVYGKLTNVALEEAYDEIMGKSSTVAAN